MPWPCWPPATSISAWNMACNLIDIAALIPIIEQAGGIVITLDGGRPEGGGNIIASGDLQLHQQALTILNS